MLPNWSRLPTRDDEGTPASTARPVIFAPMPLGQLLSEHARVGKYEQSGKTATFVSRAVDSPSHDSIDTVPVTGGTELPPEIAAAVARGVARHAGHEHRFVHASGAEVEGESPNPTAVAVEQMSFCRRRRAGQRDCWRSQRTAGVRNDASVMAGAGSGFLPTRSCGPLAADERETFSGCRRQFGSSKMSSHEPGLFGFRAAIW